MRVDTAETIVAGLLENDAGTAGASGPGEDAADVDDGAGVPAAETEVDR
jgi:hypothetical protein